MSFDVDIGHASRCGPREINEDFAGALRAGPHDAARGLIAAIADGVSSGGRGREAAQTTVISLLSDFFATPPTWETTVALDRLIGAQNAWLAAQNRQREGRPQGKWEAALTTLSVLVLHGQGWTVAHVGDTRAWRLAGGELHLLTQDHAFAQADLRSRLTRAVGLDDAVRVDFLQGEARIGDTFLLTSDGVHGALKARRLAELAAAGSAQEAGDAIVAAALRSGGGDNATVLVIRIIGLDAARLEDETTRAHALPALPRLRAGDTIDGYTIVAPVANTGVHRIYRARDNRSGELVTLKALHESRAADPEERAMLTHEAWLGACVTAGGAAGFVRVRKPDPAHPASALYIASDWHSGHTLEQQLDALRRDSQRAAVGDVVRGSCEIARALGRLHRQGVIHRDIKPSNLHWGDDGQWRIFDLGVALSGRESAAARELHAGTPSYINPEQWDGAPPDAASDLYALGVTLYQWLTGRLPYGEVEPYQTGRYRRDPQPPSRVRPDVPIWLDHLVLKAVALDPKQRFETAEEMLIALERGAARPVSAPNPTPLVARDPLALWKIAFALSLLLNVLLVYWLLFLPR